ncbi:ASPIC/UnbV protein [Thermoflavifilum aggregans]|uniref:ASPIC/UnbV protein n=1 Tax=Thermoflavifilum aggregans TaxID=454188 RepID=A0A2M9CS89_9BACT|nr:CRTAC1 family protein [Thermoflavifilum aggregans]PJJ74774.1 ASPIC/UnbV protein [Thermoflavifilum aggregans]
MKNQLLLVFSCVCMLLFSCHHQAEQQASSSGHSARELALEYLSENKLDEAELAFKKAIQENPEDVSNYVALCRLYLLKKNDAEAESMARSGLKKFPRQADLWLTLAQVYIARHQIAQARSVFETMLHNDSTDIRAYFGLANLDSSIELQQQHLLRIIHLRPANLVPRLKLAEALAMAHQADSARFYLQSIQKIAPDFLPAARQAYQQAMDLLENQQPEAALPYIKAFHDQMKLTGAYISGADELEMPQMFAGYFDVETNIRNLALDTSSSGPSPASDILNVMKFTDATEGSGIPAIRNSTQPPAVLAVTDYDAEGNMFLYTSYPVSASRSVPYLLVNSMGTFSPCRVVGDLAHDGMDLDAVFADYDNDGYPDLFVSTTSGIVVFKNNGDGSFTRIRNDIGLNHADHVTRMLFADLDQDGDLDLYAAGKNGNLFFRNNGDGTFTENTRAMQLNDDGTLSMDFGDWDNDGDLDIVCLDQQGVKLFNNDRHGRFHEISDSVGLRNPAYTGSVIAFGDYNNDGRLDILIAGGKNGCTLLENQPDHHFVPDKLASAQLSRALKGMQVYDAAFVDIDNDGHEDICVVGTSDNGTAPGIRLFHNEGAKGFRDISNLLPQENLQAYRLRIADYNFDGDEDIFIAGPSGTRLLRNDGGNLNHFIQIQLTGLAYGNSKNNRAGIGARIELKAGDLYQAKTVKSTLTEFGLGQRRRVDAVRILWPNGVPQTVLDPTSKQRILEQEQLKGSCPFLYTWNGKRFIFLKDMMWRSILGVPFAIHGKDTVYADSGPSKEYLLIPGEALQPNHGQYQLRITEELWETMYLDELRLYAVDHPDSVNVYTDERFVPPPYPGLTLYQVAHPHLPVRATDGYGHDLLPLLQAYDFQYVADFPLGKYQGLTPLHDLILDLGPAAANDDSLLLFLRGWIMPTDASINTALTQTSRFRQQPPLVQVINRAGQWQTVIPNMGFPMGRDKMIVIDLSHKFLTPGDRRIRIRTTMQIYWDQAFFVTHPPAAPLRISPVAMQSADLRYRGYSAFYHKGSPYGPLWYDYDRVSTGQRWRDLTGYYTRYGDVLPLLQKADDAYIIANSGDEVAVAFDATRLPALPKGWKRDFVLYSEGWVKDGDLNTACSQTVEPLPFHGMPSYPYGPEVHYPSDSAHQRYLRTYNTRKVDADDFRNALRNGTAERP